MNDLELLKGFRHELGADPRDDQVEAAWSKLTERFNFSYSRLTATNRHSIARRGTPPSVVRPAVCKQALKTMERMFPPARGKHRAKKSKSTHETSTCGGTTCRQIAFRRGSSGMGNSRT